MGVSMHQEYKRLSIEFPAEEYLYLKLACAKQGVSIKDFVTGAVIKKIEQYEDELDLKALEQTTDEDRKNAEPWEDVKKELGWKE